MFTVNFNIYSEPKNHFEKPIFTLNSVNQLKARNQYLLEYIDYYKRHIDLMRQELEHNTETIKELCPHEWVTDLSGQEFTTYTCSHCDSISRTKLK